MRRSEDLLIGHGLAPPDLPNPAPDLRHERTIRCDLERFLPAVEVGLTDQHGGWPAPPSDDDAFVAALDLVNQLAEPRLHFGERQRRHAARLPTNLLVGYVLV